jgi:hypothetical protein
MKKLLISLAALIALSTVHAELVQQFKDPTFSGSGWSTQELTIIQMEQSAKATIASQQASAASAAAAAAAQTPIAQFMSLFTSQVYSQLATQLTNNLFSSCTSANGAAIPGCNASTSGTFNINPTTVVSWYKTVDDPNFSGQSSVTLSVKNSANSSQNTSITVPISQFSF